MFHDNLVCFMIISCVESATLVAHKRHFRSYLHQTSNFLVRSILDGPLQGNKFLIYLLQSGFYQIYLIVLFPVSIYRNIPASVTTKLVLTLLHYMGECLCESQKKETLSLGGLIYIPMAISIKTCMR